MGFAGLDAHGISLDGGMGVFASPSGMWISMTSLSDVKTLSASNESYGDNPTTTNPALTMLLERANNFDAAMERISQKVDLNAVPVVSDQCWRAW